MEWNKHVLPDPRFGFACDLFGDGTPPYVAKSGIPRYAHNFREASMPPSSTPFDFLSERKSAAADDFQELDLPDGSNRTTLQNGRGAAS